MAATIADGNKVDKVVGGEKSKTITLKSSDGDQFDVAVSQTIQHMMEDPLPNVGSKILAMVEYCNKHIATSSDDAGEKEDLKSFDESFHAVRHDPRRQLSGHQGASWSLT
ncbi:hypothetical protein QYE76_004159 [Lolium multiflorum]|uniref:SKP1 component POZ domain-containing protein n=1 Tax=Lolium multiflorum TaxID=4521 RepID=A0AAD8RRI1_LOLMU|nr:hypothetical protein QYE76_004159 [Lolium multiflorum]